MADLKEIQIQTFCTFYMDDASAVVLELKDFRSLKLKIRTRNNVDDLMAKAKPKEGRKEQSGGGDEDDEWRYSDINNQGFLKQLCTVVELFCFLF